MPLTQALAKTHARAHTHAPTGYPAETPIPWGRYYRLAGACSISDANGTDSELQFRAKRQRTCLTR